MLFSKMFFLKSIIPLQKEKSISCVKNPKIFKNAQDIDFVILIYIVLMLSNLSLLVDNFLSKVFLLQTRAPPCRSPQST